MTNEQLAVFLGQIVDCLDRELYDLKQYLIKLDGTERKANLYKDGEYYARAVDQLPFLGDWSEEGVIQSAGERGYEVRFDGDPVVLGKLYFLCNRLREHIRTLKK